MPDTMAMRLQQVTLQGFQSYAEEQAIDIDEHVTLLAGRNNVGKSALLRALQIPVSRQEGATPRFRLTYEWSIDSVDLSGLQGAHSTEVVSWLMQQGNPVILQVGYEGGSASDGSIAFDELRVGSLRIPNHKMAPGGGRWADL